MTTGDENGTDYRKKERRGRLYPSNKRWDSTRTAFLLSALLLWVLPAHAKPPRHSSTSRSKSAKSARRPPTQAEPKLARIPLQADGSLPPFGLTTKTPKLPPGPQILVSSGKMPGFYDASDLSKPPVLSAPSAILMDADTGQVLWAKNADEKHYPASTTKIMTALLFIEHTKPTDIITCLDPKITQIEESSLHIKPWEKFTAKDLLYGFILRSANDGAVVIAEHVAGTVPKFADLMNTRAQELGAVNTHFVTPNGLHDPNHYTTARDMALIARAALQNERFADAVRLPERIISRSIVTQDVRIASKAKKQFYDKFPGADGVKTGYTRKSLHCFVGSATRAHRRLLSVVLGARNSAISDTTPLLSWGFKRFGATFVAHKEQPAQEVAIHGGTAATVATIAARDLHVSFDTLDPAASALASVPPPAPPLATAAPNGEPLVQSRVESSEIFAPITKGQEVGKLIVRVGQNDVAETPLLATMDVPRSAFGAAARALTPASPGSGGSGVFWPLTATAGALFAGLIGYRYYATATTKSTRRRRGRIAAARGGTHRSGPGGR